MAPKFNYTEAELLAAIKACEKGKNPAAASKKFGVPRSTLLDKLSGRTPLERRMGPSTVLTPEEESDLVTWILELSKRGFPVTKDQLLDSVAKLIVELKRPNPFANGRPGTKWYTSFLRRHPDISLRTCQNLTKNRAAITEKDVRDWFKEVEKIIEEENLSEAIKDPARVFNLDETSFYFSPDGNKALASKGSKVVYNTISSGEKENLSVLLNVNAAGDMAPPLVIFPMKRMNKLIAKSAPRDWCLGKSDSGWMTGELFYEYMTNTFYPWLVDKQLSFPIILFVDGHVSHNTYHFAKFAKANGIQMLFLLSNATHLLQPLDVGIFRPLKSEWRKVIHEYKIAAIENSVDELGIAGQRLKREDFCRELQKAIGRSVTPTKIQNAFQGSGIFPLDADSVKYSNLTSNPVNKVAPKNLNSKKTPTSSKNLILQYLEEYLGQEKRDRFLKAKDDIWLEDVENKALFEFWRHTRESVARLNPSVPANLSKEPSELISTESVNINNSQYNNSLVQSNELLPESNDEESLLLTEELLDNAEFIFTDPCVANEVASDVADENAYNFEIVTIFDSVSDETLEMNVDVISPTNFIDDLDDPDDPRVNITSQEQPTRTIADDLNIPSVFKETLFWPAEIPNKKSPKKKKKILPANATSEKWIQYFEERENQKAQKEEGVAKRRAERLKKKEALEAEKQEKAEKRAKKKETIKKKI